MKRYSDVFTQGGQTELHKFHMLKQVFGTTFKISIIISIISFILLLYWSHPLNDFYLLGVYYKAYFRIQMDFLPKEFFDSSWVTYDQIGWHELTDFQIATNPSLIKFVYYLQLEIQKILYRSMYMLTVSLICISAFWIWRGKQRQTSRIIRGYELVKPAELIKQVLKIGSSKIKVGSIPLPLDAECEHMMITGTTGSGKSNLIYSLLQQIKDLGHKAIIIDTSGVIVSRFFDENKDSLLNPFDKRSKGWDLWKECIEDYEFDEFSESLIPDARYDQFWTKAGQQLFSEGAMQIKKTKDYSIDKLLKVLLAKPLKEICELFKNTLVSSYVEPTAEKTAFSIRATLVSALRNLKYLEGSENKFSIREWINQTDNGWLFISSLPTQREVLKPLMSAWLSIGVKSLMSLGEDRERRVWFIIDEVASLNRLGILMQGLSELRKFGGCFVLGLQDVQQLNEIYGTNIARVLGGLSGTKVVSRLDSYAAKEMSELFGQQEILESNESISYGAHKVRDGVSLTEHRTLRPVIAPSEIMKLNNLEAYLKFPRDLPFTKMKFDFYHYPQKYIPFIPKKKLVELPEQLEQDNLEHPENNLENKKIIKLKKNVLLKSKKSIQKENSMEISE